MPKDPLIDPWKRYSGQDYRRSSRVKCNVPLLVYGQDSSGEKFVEKTHILDVNLHGSSFLSRHSCLPGSYVTLRFGHEQHGANHKVVRTQVKRSDPQRDSRGMFRVGVELGIPGNVWSYSPVPMDWLRLLGSAPDSESSAPAIPMLVACEKPAPAPPPPPPLDPLPDNQPIEIHLDMPADCAPLTPFPPSQTSESTVSPDTAILMAIEKYLEPALARALSTLELQTRASMRQLRETVQRPANPIPVDSTLRDLDSLLDERLAGIRAQWDLQLDGYLLRMEECVQRMERHAALAEQRLTAAQEIIAKSLQNFSRQLEEQVNYAVKRAAEAIAQKAALSVDHQLVRLTEDAHFVAREINSMVETDSAAARAELESALRALLEELRTQSEIQAKRLASDTRQKVTSALAALEAEHLALCETRLKTIDNEIAESSAKATSEFRQGLRAFFYSCLVAAVGAVEEHAKTTLDGLSSDPDQPPLPKP